MKRCGNRAFQDAMFVRLFRVWAMAREDNTHALPAMHKEAMQRGYQDQTASACASLFELVEAHLGRRLVRECCCSQTFSADEKALLGILRFAPSLSAGRGSRAVPHGLPGAISWAASCVCDARGLEDNATVMALHERAANRQDCPFGADQSAPQGGKQNEDARHAF